MSEGAEWNDKIVEMARAFHDEYEVQAKRFGWQSQTPVPFDELPEANKQTMLNVIAQVVPWNVVADLADLRAQLAQRDGEIEALRGERDEFRDSQSYMAEAMRILQRERDDYKVSIESVEDQRDELAELATWFESHDRPTQRQKKKAEWMRRKSRLAALSGLSEGTVVQ